jgi:oligopeptide transport system ATP-binding protein
VKTRLIPPERATGLPADTVLHVTNLQVTFKTSRGAIDAVRDATFSVKRGETLALVGESGSGKSVTSLGLLGLTPPAPACRVAGQALLRRKDGSVVDLIGMPEDKLRELRGSDMAMIFQEPMTSFNPVQTIGDQICEAILVHQRIGPHAARKRAAELLDLVGIVDPQRRLDNYPHQLSGGMRQRAMIAMAISCEPQLLIADEPTTALDVTIQAQILQLLRKLQAQTQMALVFITHNLGVVAEVADRVMVMYAGRVVEQAGAVSLFDQPLMPYTSGLMQSVPRLDLAGRSTGPLPAIPGNVPDAQHMPPGCAFEPRCAHRVPGRCDTAMPPLEEAAADRWVRCVRWRELAGNPLESMR